MKFADRLKVIASSMSSTTLAVNATITMGAAVTGCRTLSQAINASEIAVGDTNVPFVVDDGAGNWQNSLFTITSSTVITCTKIITSSNNGAAVTFSGASPSVFNSAAASILNAGLINPYDPGFDIILLIGQSNMVGQDVSNSALDIVDARIFTYGGFSNEAATYRKITQAVDPLRHNLNPASYATLPSQGAGVGLGPGSWLARTYAGMVPSNRKILLVPAARSNTKLFADTREWFPGDGTLGSGTTLGATGSTLLDNAIDQATRALTDAQAMYPNSRFVGTAWHQGEGDADFFGANLQLNYQGALKTLIQAICTRVPGATKSWFVIGGLMPENIADTSGHPGYTMVDAAHRTVATEVAHCAFAVGPSGFHMVDNLHYNAAGHRILGCSMASVIPSAIASSGNDTTAPVTRSATVYASTTSTVAVALSEPFDPAYPPQASAWTVTGHTVTSASGNGNYVYLTLSTPFTNGEAQRTVAYTAPGSGGMRDFAGNVMGTQSAINITNNAPATATGVTLTGPTSGTAGQASTNFTVGVTPNGANIVGTVVVTPSDAGAGGTFAPTTVSLTTASPTGTFTYTPSAAGTDTISVTNSGSLSNPTSITYTATASDTQAPSFSSAQVANASPTVVQLTMNETLANSIPPNSSFAITENGSAKTVSGVSVSGTVVSITCSAAFTNGTSIQLTYTAPGTSPRIQDAAGNATATFGPVTVTNNVAASGGTDLRFPNVVAGNMTETSATTPYSYTTNAAQNFGSGAQGASTTLAAAGDFTLEMTINVVTARQMIGFKTSAANTAYANIPFVFWAENSGGGGYKLRGTAASQPVTGRAPANNDKVRISRSGSTVSAYVSSDAGTTWTLILTWTQSGTLYCQILSESNGQFNGPIGTGWA